MMAAILTAMFDWDTALFDSDTLLSSDSLKITLPPLWLTQTNVLKPSWHSCHFELVLGFSHFAQKKLHSFILTQLDDGSHLESLPSWIDTLPSWIQTPCYLLSDSLKKTHHSTLILTQTNSIWLKLIHSHLTWWWQPSCILPSWISAILNSRHTSLIHSDSTWWWQPLEFCTSSNPLWLSN